MNNHLETLKNFQEWRRDEPAATFRQLGLTPKAIGEALDWAIRELNVPDWATVGDGTLHGAIDHWQSEAIKEKSLRQHYQEQLGALQTERARSGLALRAALRGECGSVDDAFYDVAMLAQERDEAFADGWQAATESQGEPAMYVNESQIRSAKRLRDKGIQVGSVAFPMPEEYHCPVPLYTNPPKPTGGGVPDGVMRALELAENPCRAFYKQGHDGGYEAYESVKKAINLLATQQPPAPKPDHSDANKKAADGEQGQ